MTTACQTLSLPTLNGVVMAALRREWLSHRLNRFLYAHVALVLTVGTLPLLTPGDGFSRGVVWWLLHGVLYAVSLSSLLLGLSSAHAEAEERVWILGQPSGTAPWLAGKALGLVVLTMASTALIGVPAFVLGAGSTELALVTAGSTGIAGVCAMLGFALGFWIRDGVRGLIVSVAAWFLMLFGLDLLLLGVAGAPWVQEHPDAWVALLMSNPLDAFRVTVLFSVERAAFGGFNTGTLTSWWAAHSGLWLGVLCTAWILAGVFLAWSGIRRKSDDL